MSTSDKDLILQLLAKLQQADRKIHYYEQLLRQNGISYDFSSEQAENSNHEPSKDTNQKSDSENLPPSAVSDTAVKGPSSTPQKQRSMVREPITADHIKLFRSIFRGREEFYAKRTKYQTYTRPCWNRYDQNGLCPKQRDSRIPCKECTNKHFKLLDDRTIAAHLNGAMVDGSDVIGIYPITRKNTCWFIVFDFDDKNHAKLAENAAHNETLTGKDVSFWSEVICLADICDHFGVPYLMERSRSGFGAHLWIFFDQEIDCADARRFGNSLLSQGMKTVNVSKFRTYDRMMPMQDALEENQAGNLIALPLQGRALRAGNSAFVNKKQQVYPNQWNVLRNLKKLSKDSLYQFLETWKQDDPYGESTILFESEDDPSRPWDLDRDVIHPEDITGTAEAVLANGIYISKDCMKVRLQNQIRRLALYRNPEYFKARHRNNEISSLKNPYYMYCGKDIGNYINLPRGCTDALLSLLSDAGIRVALQDKRSKGKHLDVSFNGTLKENQTVAVAKLNQTSCGIISAATAFGKTVVGAELIAERKVSTLIIVNRSEILEGWFDTLTEFLTVNEELPEYSTPTGRIKKRSTCIGRYGSSRKELNGIIDIAMIQSLVNQGTVKKELETRIKQYGMVIVDECHHVAGDEYQEVLNTVMAQYVYGFTATPKRYDSQDKKMYFQLGEIKYRFSAKDRSYEQNIDHLINPRFTPISDKVAVSNDYNKMLDSLTEDEPRNRMIISDVLKCIKDGRTPMILTKRVAHAERLHQMLEGKADHVFNMAGKQTAKETRIMMEERKHVPDDESVILISTGSKAGEGFNYPRLDTLMLAAPVSWEGSIEQYAGRLNRDYPGKKNVIIFDYVDSGIPIFEHMYRKRLNTYRQIGFEVCATPSESTVVKDTIYNGISFRKAFADDICSAKRNVIIFSPYLSGKILIDFISAASEALQRGTIIQIVTLCAEKMDQEFTDTQKRKIMSLRKNGFIVTVTENMKFDCNYAIIDQSVVWYGDFSLLSKGDEDNDIIRFIDSCAASSLLKSAMRTAGIQSKTHALRTRLDI